MSFDTPILFITFNRPDTTIQVFESIKMARPARLYVANDAPRQGNKQDEEMVVAVRALVKRVDWPCEVKYLFQEQNLGCSLGPRAAFKWFFDQEEEGIILEDDCLPDPSFFSFCSILLEKYKDDEKIISISGCNLGYHLTTGDSYSFSKFMNMWGWATWKRSADKIDYSLAEWKQEKKPVFSIYKRLRQNVFDFDIVWFKYWKSKFDLTINKKNISWWDWQWIYHQTRDKQYSIVPAVNLVKNLGFGEHATHTKEEHNPAAQLDSNQITFPLKHPSKMKNDIRYEETFVKWVWCYHKRVKLSRLILNRVKRTFS